MADGVDAFFRITFDDQKSKHLQVFQQTADIISNIFSHDFKAESYLYTLL